MISVRKRGKAYEYRFSVASIDGVRKWIQKSDFKTKQEALQQGALAYNEYYKVGRVQKQKNMSYLDFLDYWIDTYSNFNLKYSTKKLFKTKTWHVSSFPDRCTGVAGVY